jgi:23S rRNA (uracil1939-C5)-methyltransferase
MSEVMELELTGMAYGGDAFGRDLEGRMVFVPFSLPGERVQVEIVEEHARWARARLLDVTKPSPDRIRPRCKHFADCGGCHYQHMPYEAQLRAKEEILRDQLKRIGKFEQPPVSPTSPSPSPWNTRNHLQFKLTSQGRLGFNAAGSGRIVPIDECHLPQSTLADLWPRIDLQGSEGIERVSVRAGVDGEMMVILKGESKPPFEMHVDAPVSVVWISDDRRATMAGDPILEMQVLDRPFVVSPGSFFQVNAALAGELVTRTLDALEVQIGTTVFDLYAGVGLFSAFLAERGARLVAVEDSSSACADFEVNLEAFEDIQLYEAPVEMALPKIPEQPDAIVVDPPRAGLSREALDGILAQHAPQLVYISCDAATFARDARRLNDGGYDMLQATPIDLFPQTYHIEIFSHWRNRTAESGAN